MDSYQCNLCPRKYTRAFTLRNHLRTHTDERPFVCTVCGKAFARKHDRNSHELLHTGEKRFVCKGPLKSGQRWGCGRRFSRGANFKRHLCSGMGRSCIKPLLEEEAEDRATGRRDALGVTRLPQLELREKPSFEVTLANVERILNDAYEEVSTQRNVSPTGTPAPLYIYSAGTMKALDNHTRIQLLEKIIRDKGFNVDVELAIELQKSEMGATLVRQPAQ